MVYRQKFGLFQKMFLIRRSDFAFFGSALKRAGLLKRPSVGRRYITTLCRTSRLCGMERRKLMAYTKPVILAQNSKDGMFAAGCPSSGTSGPSSCKRCERSQ